MSSPKPRQRRRPYPQDLNVNSLSSIFDTDRIASPPSPSDALRNQPSIPSIHNASVQVVRSVRLHCTNHRGRKSPKNNVGPNSEQQQHGRNTRAPLYRHIFLKQYLELRSRATELEAQWLHLHHNYHTN